VVPETGDTVTAQTYAFLSDAQPRCPAGTIGMTYSVRAHGARLDLTTTGFAPDHSYRAPGRDRWDGRVPSPSPSAN
jgi:hypothetical protein